MTEECKKMEPVVDKGKIVSAKKRTSKKIVESFIQKDGQDLKDIIIFDWIIPGLQNLILDTLSRSFFGTSYNRNDRGRYDRDRDRNYGRVNYSGYSRREDRERDRRDSREEEIDYRSIVLIDRPSAEDVVRKIQDEIHDRGEATIAQLLELVHLPSKYTDCSWGWTRENDISIRRVRDGYLIDVREARYLG